MENMLSFISSSPRAPLDQIKKNQMKFIQYAQLSFMFLLSYTLSAQDDLVIEKEIQAIENGLQKSLQIKGDSVLTFNIQDRMSHYKVPGVSIAIVKDGALRWAKGYGVANTDTNTEVDENTLFQAGSISKPVAALAALSLYENGKVDLDADVNEYLKGWNLPESEFTKVEKVSMRRLLTHTAGTTVHGFPGYAQSDTFPSIVEVLSGDGNTGVITVDTIPGSLWRYSGGGYTIMEKAVEDVSGLSLDEILSQRIFSPLNMSNSTFEQPISEKYQSNISAAYDGNGSIIKGLWHNYPEQAAAGLWTTPSDLAKYCVEIQEIANGKESGILKRSTVDEMLTKHQNDWGLGPSLSFDGKALAFGHGGKNAGFTNNMTASAYQGHAVIVMTNADNGGSLIGEIQNAVAEVYGWPVGKSKTIEIVELEQEELQKFEGKYSLKGQGLTVSFALNDGQLSALTPIGLLQLSPMSKSRFIDLKTELMIRFVGEEKVEGFEANNGMVFERVEE